MQLQAAESADCNIFQQINTIFRDFDKTDKTVHSENS